MVPPLFSSEAVSARLVNAGGWRGQWRALRGDSWEERAGDGLCCRSQTPGGGKAGARGVTVAVFTVCGCAGTYVNAS